MNHDEPAQTPIALILKPGSTAVRHGLELFLLSFLALFLELMVIRWAPSVVRMVAYYQRFSRSPNRHADITL